MMSRLPEQEASSSRGMLNSETGEFDLNSNSFFSASEEGLPAVPGDGVCTASVTSEHDPSAECLVDETPLGESLTANKESLQIKLLTRRPMSTLVAQGILPPMNSPHVYHEQKQKLERAKIGDILKAKIQARPRRDQLVQHHILLEESSHVDPSLVERSRQLKKAKLADTLNEHLSHRPGPLELIQGNILHPGNEEIEKAVKEGTIEFKKTSEGTLSKNPPRPFVVENEQEQATEEEKATLSVDVEPGEVGEQCSQDLKPAFTRLPDVGTAPVVVRPSEESEVSTEDKSKVAAPWVEVNKTPLQSLLPSEDESEALSSSATGGFLAGTLSLVSLGGITLLPSRSATTQTLPRVVIPVRANGEGGGKVKSLSRNKAKMKFSLSNVPFKQNKPRKIIFHEYKGPPDAQQSEAQSSSVQSETAYDLLLRQQQLLLQWDTIRRIRPAPENSSGDMMRQSSPLPARSLTPATITDLENMKVSELRAECKKRNLPVSGTKLLLVERLRPLLKDFRCPRSPRLKDTSSSSNGSSDSSPCPSSLTLLPTSNDSDNQSLGSPMDSDCSRSFETPMEVDEPSPWGASRVSSGVNTEISFRPPPTPPPLPESGKAPLPQEKEIIVMQKRKIDELEKRLEDQRREMERIRKEKEMMLIRSTFQNHVSPRHLAKPLEATAENRNQEGTASSPFGVQLAVRTASQRPNPGEPNVFQSLQQPSLFGNPVTLSKSRRLKRQSLQETASTGALSSSANNSLVPCRITSPVVVKFVGPAPVPLGPTVPSSPAAATPVFVPQVSTRAVTPSRTVSLPSFSALRPFVSDPMSVQYLENGAFGGHLNTSNSDSGFDDPEDLLLHDLMGDSLVDSSTASNVFDVCSEPESRTSNWNEQNWTSSPSLCDVETLPCDEASTSTSILGDVKSEVIDDIINILVQQGELPASALRQQMETSHPRPPPTPPPLPQNGRPEPQRLPTVIQSLKRQGREGPFDLDAFTYSEATKLQSAEQCCTPTSEANDVSRLLASWATSGASKRSDPLLPQFNTCTTIIAPGRTPTNNNCQNLDPGSHPEQSYFQDEDSSLTLSLSFPGNSPHPLPMEGDFESWDC